MFGCNVIKMIFNVLEDSFLYTCQAGTTARNSWNAQCYCEKRVANGGMGAETLAMKVEQSPRIEQTLE